MPSARKAPARKPVTKARRKKKKQQKKHRGPLMRFKFGRLVLLWILSLIICFGSYIYNRNMHPEKDVFVKSAEPELPEESSLPAEEESVPDETPVEESVPDPAAEDNTGEETAENGESENGEGEGEGEEDESGNVHSGPTKVNPVPETAMQPMDYLTRCAFLGETNIHNLSVDGILQPNNVYASETLNLNNYTREYVMLNGTTIRILSVINSASCPIYLMFGTESLSEQPADQTADQFDVFLNSVIAVAPEAKIYILSIPPVTAAAEQASPPLLNSTVDEYNSLLLELANKHNVYFVDTNTALKNNESRLAPEYALEDGIHLNSDGLQIMMNYVLCHVPE
ncbi:MAG TPA: hypothetical protein DDX71_03925 [Ruminococcus sp.]|nr:hypothetical protein [Ruminococcus sp.]